MDHHQLFPAGDHKVETCIIGTGSFGRSYWLRRCAYQA